MSRSLLFGAFFGLALFGAETALVLSNEAAGLSIDVKGPFAALIAIAKAELPWLLAKVIAVYLFAGVVGAALAHALARLADQRRLAFVSYFFALAMLPIWARAIRTPALFDDVPRVTPVLRWIVDVGEPWHPWAAAAAVLALWIIAVRRAGNGARALAYGVIVGFVAAVSFIAGAIERRVESAHPLVLVFGVDALRTDRLAAFGAERSVVPKLDVFIAEATLFTQAYTPIAQTEPAWRSLLTGALPAEHGLRYALIKKSERLALPTFASAFAAAGYQTVFRTDCSRFNFQDETSGFATRIEPPRGALNFLLEKLRYRGVVTYAGARLAGWIAPELAHNRALAGFYDAKTYAEIVAADVVARAKDGPLLYAYHATAAHFPGDPEYPFYRRFSGPSTPLARRLRMHFRPVASVGAADPSAAETDRALYDALVAQADMQLGVILDRLKRAGLYERATIVVLSDHGEDFYEDTPALKGAMSVHGASLNERQNRIVLAARVGAKRRGPAEVSALVRLIDVGPTLLELARLPAPVASGRSFAPIFDGKAIASQRLLAETAFTHVLPSVLVPGHYSGARRDFEAYHLHDDGLVEVNDATHEQVMLEKDYGAFDGQNWIIAWRNANGTMKTRCAGECEQSGLRAWFDQEAARMPLVYRPERRAAAPTSEDKSR
ncbi:MAG: sulfatase-like hydrolase/transferase [Deltaproteobacteria bacterium]|nr:sulfatase-like hydrolase/transferase [Deltaproteobacteria bacterium]